MLFDDGKGTGGVYDLVVCFPLFLRFADLQGRGGCVCRGFGHVGKANRRGKSRGGSQINCINKIKVHWMYQEPACVPFLCERTYGGKDGGLDLLLLLLLVEPRESEAGKRKAKVAADEQIVLGTRVEEDEKCDKSQRDGALLVYQKSTANEDDVVNELNSGPFPFPLLASLLSSTLCKGAREGGLFLRYSPLPRK